MKLKFIHSSALVISAIFLLAASCGRQPNSLDRPALETNQNTSVSQETPTEDNGEIAGAETIQLPTKKIKLGGSSLEVEVAVTDEATAKGLSGREKLDEGKGMLFDFTNSELKQPGFWMKDMLISIDIIWIGTDGKVSGVQAGVPIPEEDKDYPIYYPPSNISYVLEVPAGWAEKNNIKVGALLTIE